MLGSGIFVSPGGVMANAGSFGSSIIIWVVCGLFSLLGGLCYAELATVIPESGGDYTYCNRIFPDIIGFLRLWVEVIIIRPGCHAAVAVTFAVHILQVESRSKFKFKNGIHPKSPRGASRLVFARIVNP